MAERIYLLADQGDLSEMTEERFDTEATLQALIARHPELLAGEQIDPRDPPRWILVRREKGIADTSEAEYARWAVDHLLIDQNAVPTLVEVKRGDNRELRRTVVGQMLEYAAHASRTWTADELRRVFERQAEEREESAYELLSTLVNEEEVDEDSFWADVAKNLAANQLRLLFVADDIPNELARVVEFLNEQMRDNIEVLAVEIKQFRGESGQILVPQVIGLPSAKSKIARSRSQAKLTRESFLGAVGENDVRAAYARFFDVAEEHGAEIGYSAMSAIVRARIRGYERQPWVARLRTPGANPLGDIRDFALGYTAKRAHPPPIARRLDEWFNDFADLLEPSANKDLRARKGTQRDAVRHADLIAERLAAVLDDLSAIEI